MTSKLEHIVKEARLKSKPQNVSPKEWANAMNWNIEAWKCILNGQKWVHEFEICCPEQYHMLLNKKGQFILSDSENVVFKNTNSIRIWLKELEQQVADMRSKSEWIEALQWSMLIKKITHKTLPTPNEAGFVKTKKIVKGYKLVRIKSAA